MSDVAEARINRFGAVGARMLVRCGASDNGSRAEGRACGRIFAHTRNRPRCPASPKHPPTIANPGGPSWDRTSDLPRVKGKKWPLM